MAIRPPAPRLDAVPPVTAPAAAGDPGIDGVPTLQRHLARIDHIGRSYSCRGIGAEEAAGTGIVLPGSQIVEAGNHVALLAGEAER